LVCLLLATRNNKNKIIIGKDGYIKDRSDLVGLQIFVLVF
jgi:hypothetical protein